MGREPLNGGERVYDEILDVLASDVGDLASTKEVVRRLTSVQGQAGRVAIVAVGVSGAGKTSTAVQVASKWPCMFFTCHDKEGYVKHASVDLTAMASALATGDNNFHDVNAAKARAMFGLLLLGRILLFKRLSDGGLTGEELCRAYLVTQLAPGPVAEGDFRALFSEISLSVALPELDALGRDIAVCVRELRAKVFPDGRVVVVVDEAQRLNTAVTVEFPAVRVVTPVSDGEVSVAAKPRVSNGGFHSMLAITAAREFAIPFMSLGTNLKYDDALKVLGSLTAKDDEEIVMNAKPLCCFDMLDDESARKLVYRFATPKARDVLDTTSQYNLWRRISGRPRFARRFASYINGAAAKIGGTPIGMLKAAVETYDTSVVGTVEKHPRTSLVAQFKKSLPTATLQVGGFQLQHLLDKLAAAHLFSGCGMITQVISADRGHHIEGRVDLVEAGVTTLKMSEPALVHEGSWVATLELREPAVAEALSAFFQLKRWESKLTKTMLDLPGMELGKTAAKGNVMELALLRLFRDMQANKVSITTFLSKISRHYHALRGEQAHPPVDMSTLRASVCDKCMPAGTLIQSESSPHPDSNLLLEMVTCAPEDEARDWLLLPSTMAGPDGCLRMQCTSCQSPGVILIGSKLYGSTVREAVATSNVCTTDPTLLYRTSTLRADVTTALECLPCVRVLFTLPGCAKNSVKCGVYTVKRPHVTDVVAVIDVQGLVPAFSFGNHDDMIGIVRAVLDLGGDGTGYKTVAAAVIAQLKEAARDASCGFSHDDSGGERPSSDITVGFAVAQAAAGARSRQRDAKRAHAYASTNSRDESKRKHRTRRREADARGRAAGAADVGSSSGAGAGAGAGAGSGESAEIPAAAYNRVSGRLRPRGKHKGTGHT